MEAWCEIYASTESAGTARDPKRTFASGAAFEVWARRRSLSAKEETVAAARGSAEEVVFEMYPISGLTEQHRILHDGELYDITGINQFPHGNRALIHVYARRGRSYGS